MRQHENEKRKPHDLTVDLNSARLSVAGAKQQLPKGKENEIKWKKKGGNWRVHIIAVHKRYNKKKKKLV